MRKDSLVILHEQFQEKKKKSVRGYKGSVKVVFLHYKNMFILGQISLIPSKFSLSADAPSTFGK